MLIYIQECQDAFRIVSGFDKFSVNFSYFISGIGKRTAENNTRFLRYTA